MICQIMGLLSEEFACKLKWKVSPVLMHILQNPLLLWVDMNVCDYFRVINIQIPKTYRTLTLSVDWLKPKYPCDRWSDFQGVFGIEFGRKNWGSMVHFLGKALCPIPRYGPGVRHEKNFRCLRSIGLSESCHNFFRSWFRRVCLSALKVILPIVIYKIMNMPSLNHIIR